MSEIKINRLRNSSGSLAIFAAIRRASSHITIKLSPARLIAPISLSDGPCRPAGTFPETPYGSSHSGHRISKPNRNDVLALFVQPAYDACSVTSRDISVSSTSKTSIQFRCYGGHRRRRDRWGATHRFYKGRCWRNQVKPHRIMKPPDKPHQCSDRHAQQ